MKQIFVIFSFILLSQPSDAQISVKYATSNNTEPWQIVKKRDGNYCLLLMKRIRHKALLLPSLKYLK